MQFSSSSTPLQVILLYLILCKQFYIAKMSVTDKAVNILFLTQRITVNITIFVTAVYHLVSIFVTKKYYYVLVCSDCCLYLGCYCQNISAMTPSGFIHVPFVVQDVLRKFEPNLYFIHANRYLIKKKMALSKCCIQISARTILL